MRTTDLAAVSKLTQAHGAALVVDVTLAGPGTAPGVAAFADVLCLVSGRAAVNEPAGWYHSLPLQSLTKYFSPAADVLAGAVCCPAASPRGASLAKLLTASGDDDEAALASRAAAAAAWPGYAPLHALDAIALAAQLDGVPAHMAALNAHTVAVAEWLELSFAAVGPSPSTRAELAALAAQLMERRCCSDGGRGDPVGGEARGCACTHVPGTVARVHWARKGSGAAEFERLSRGGGPGAVITVELAGTAWPTPAALARWRQQQRGVGGGAPSSDDASRGGDPWEDGPEADAVARSVLAAFYDACGGGGALLRGPSFGARFSIACPFVFLAHYDLAESPAGRARLREKEGVRAAPVRRRMPGRCTAPPLPSPPVQEPRASTPTSCAYRSGAWRRPRSPALAPAVWRAYPTCPACIPPQVRERHAGARLRRAA